MKKKYVALMAGVGAAMAIGAPMAMAATPEIPSLPGAPALPSAPAFPGVPSLPDAPALPGAPSLPGFPGAEPNGATCSFEAGSGSAESNVPAYTPPAPPALPDTNQGNCQSFGNDQHNGEHSNGEYVFPPAGGETPDVPVEGIPNQ